jgi:phosphoglycolate phosphatase-like HAD superfamily hydrolase
VNPLLICDFDGVLVDLDLDGQAVRRRIGELFAAHGIVERWRPLLATLERALADVAAREGPIPSRALWQAAWAIIDEEERVAAGRCRLWPGARTFLDRLRGHSCALFSNNHVEAIEIAFRRVGIEAATFGRLVARTGPGSIKPSGQIVVDLASADWGRPIDRIVLIGDHPHDMLSARQAAQHFAAHPAKAREVVAIGLPRQPAGTSALVEAGASFIAADLADAATLALGETGPGP